MENYSKSYCRNSHSKMEEFVSDDCLRLVFCFLGNSTRRNLIFSLSMKFVNHRWKRVVSEMWSHFDSAEFDFYLPFKSQFCLEAVHFGWVELIKWAYSNGCPLYEDILFSIAARRGDLDTLKWGKMIILQKEDMGKSICHDAASRNHYEVVKWAAKIGIHLDEYVCVIAAKQGNLEMIKWFQENGCPLGDETCCVAAESGDFQLLKWVVKNGCLTNCPEKKHSIIQRAIKGNNFDIVKWLHSEGFVANTRYDCLIASRNNNLEILQWLRKNGCPWNKDSCLKEAKNLEIIQWINSN
eukprot:TRINITY_DN15113_c0_g1_i1.p1 TRINITY_DN15113_c0_g1~~TRINITY_DN15113_c0_g1_i1.p1  ORF type:complete len:296 (-),score=33.17 TRINITY_DN15113_c0_g1_i1:102-989(-)